MKSPVEPPTDVQSPIKAPKRPLSPFLFYSQEARQRLRLKRLGFKTRDIMKIVREDWAKMPSDQKLIYKKLSEESRAEYELEKNEFERRK